MPPLFNDVQPGDLITADLMNRVLHEVQQLEDRLTALEEQGPTGGAVFITDLSGTLRIGETLTVLGGNFEVPASLNIVTMDGVRIDRFIAGSNDTTLVFGIPRSLNGAPRTATLTINN